ncbi:acyl-[acyl-carrier-protein] thioesterase [Pontibacter sp. SGAir0037]|uniref:acyl-[acyl-carrier-protein] thioesterase n=1 Tax=Pontibacter sp. SGAir0037 TaxID=2571030 RepID=UPI0010CD5832|nr:acyl-ACP thioesterase domain-containing protein [Pontibacter sp. SGAir0037]QCR24171.1 acyl-ACP thioesterase [Pontibacter sp. SGAir0037]
MSKGGESTFIVRSSEIDFRGQVTLPVLVSYLQEAAWDNTTTLGISMYDLLEKGLTWVLSRLRIEMFRYPKHRDQVMVETWASGREKVFLHRDFRIYNAERELLGQATSVWLVMDVVKRQLTSVPDFITAVEIATGYEPLPFAKGKLPALAEAAFEQHVQVKWHDIDLNRHVNNTHYLRWALEALPIEVLEQQQLREADIIFRSESTLGDTIVSLAAPTEPGLYLHKLADEATGKELVQAQTKWK